MSTLKVEASDQAAGLRRLFAPRGAQIIAMTSAAAVGGRSQLLAEAAGTLAARGRRVLLIDENPGPRNAASLLGDAARQAGDLLQVIRGEINLPQAVARIGRGFELLNAVRLANAELPLTRRLSDLLQMLVDGHDFILIDCSASRTSQISTLGLQAHYLVVAVTAESNGIMQAYAQIKRLAQIHQREHFHVVVSGRTGRDEARTVFNNLRQVAQEHLGVHLNYLGLASAGRSEMLADLLDTGLTLQAMPPTNAMHGLLESLGGLRMQDSMV